MGSGHRDLPLGDAHRIRNVFTDTSVSGMRMSRLACCCYCLCRYMLARLKSRVDFAFGAVGNGSINGLAVASDED